ncbi:MAG TPA: glycogen synthase GlgA [Burkholderiales bacterium]|nr:glycogen synthase GlgA [Burkholderiales bacterium]
MRVLFVTSECAPLTKTGGLGDVSAALPAALRELGVDVRVLLPGYRAVLRAQVHAGPAAAFRVAGFDCRLLESRLPDGVPVYLLDCPPLYGREGGPYQSAEGVDWPDNALRFGVLSAAAALVAQGRGPSGWHADLLHCNDWPAALAPAYAPDCPSLLTIHNLAFQGNFAPDVLHPLGLPPELYAPERAEFYGKLSFLKAGIVCAHAIATVSPTYAAEIRTEEFGCGLHGVLERRKAELHGILNGIDTREWDPATDLRIEQNYDAGSLERKAANKAALQRRLGLAANPAVPLLGVVGRLTHQKGIDLIASAADELAALPAQLAILGKGEREHEIAVAACAARHPGRIAAAIGFNEDLAHAIEAGADVFLMPSRFEPCGLNQMYSQRYGTLPVARATGGLVDTITDGETGFLFRPAETAALVGAVRRALEVHARPAQWRALQRAAMARNFSWSAAARQYAALYRRLATPVAA